MTGSQRRWGGAVLVTALGFVAGMGCRTAPVTRAENLGKELGEKINFIHGLAQFDSTQMRMGELAATKSSDPEVQQLGQRMADDHRAHLEMLSSFAEGRIAEAKRLKEAGAEQGVGGSGLQGEDQAYQAVLDKMQSYENKSARTEARDEKKLQQLGELSESEFDREFVNHVRESQQEGKRFVEQGIERFNTDANLTTLLARTTPVLDQHISMASALRK